MICQLLLLPLTIILTVIIPLIQTVLTTVCGWVSSVITVIKQVVDKVCSWLPWPLDKLCNWVSKTIQVLETVWNWVCNTVTKVIVTFLTFVTSLVIFITRIICIIITVIIRIPGWILCMIGLSVPKKIRVCVKIITDDNGQSKVTEKAVLESIATMKRIYEHCNVSVDVDGIERIAAPNLLTSTDDSFWSLFSPWHAWFSQHACSCCGQVTVFFVDKIQGSSDGFTFWGDNWCRVDATANSDPTIMAHEIGHLCNLWHVSDNNNLMFPNSGPPENPRNTLTRFQCCTLRLSTFVNP